MDYQSILAVSAAGMTFERARLEAAALNLANMHASAPPGQAGFKPVRAVAAPVDFASAWDALQRGGVIAANGLAAAEVRLVAVEVPDRLVQDPVHPHADANGNVRLPGVDHAREMLTATTALRAYEANVAAAGLARSMVQRALDIGGQ